MKIVFIILASLGVLLATLGSIFTDLYLPLSEKLAFPKPSTNQSLALLKETSPIRKIEYLTLVNRLGRSGKIPWVNRTTVSSGLIKNFGRVAIVGWMKSGKTRESAELIRLALEEGLINVVYEPTSTLDLIELNELTAAIIAKLDDRQRLLFFIDELGLRPEPDRLERLSICVNTITSIRPDAYFLITIQKERLTPTIDNWLTERTFHKVLLPPLTIEQRRIFTERSARVLGVRVNNQIITTLAKRTDGRPYSIVFALQRAPNADLSDIRTVNELLALGDSEAWAEKRREIIQAMPVAEILLNSIITFVSAGVTPREKSVFRYASYIINPNKSSHNNDNLLHHAAQYWQAFDIIATEGSFTVPEPLLLPLITDVDTARKQLLDFVESYKPSHNSLKFFTSLLNSLSKLRNKFKFQHQRNSTLYSIRHLFYRIAIHIETKFLAWSLVKNITSWPADRALLLMELGKKERNPEYFSSIVLIRQGRDAFRNNDLQLAFSYLNKAIALDTRNANAYGLRGATFFKAQQYNDALTDLNHALELKPKTYWCLAWRGIVYYHLHRYDDAMTEFNLSINSDSPDLDWVFAWRAMTQLHLQRHQDALASSNRALEINPKIDWYYYVCSLTHHFLGNLSLSQVNLQKAIDIAENIRNSYPRDWKNNLRLASYYLASGKYQKAEHLYLTATRDQTPKSLIMFAITELNNYIDFFPDESQPKAIREILKMNDI